MATAAKKKEKPAVEAVKEEEPAQQQGLDITPPEEDGEPEILEYKAPIPTETDRKTAEKVYAEVKKADILGHDAAISALLQLVDVHPKFIRPQEWPGKEDDEYHESELLQEMALILHKGCKNITIRPHDVVFLWRNKEKWVNGGKTVRGNVKRFPKRVVFLLEGKLAAIEINFHHWKAMNPLQRIFSVYHELRQVSKDGSGQPPDFTGYYDEIEVFGPRVFMEGLKLQRVMEIGSQVQFQHQLGLFDEDE